MNKHKQDLMQNISLCYNKTRH